MSRWLPLGLAAAALVVGGTACGQKQSGAESDDWMLVFRGDQNGEWATFAVGRGGGEPVRISANEAPSEARPVPSPDGRSIILPDASGLIVMATDGTTRRHLDSWEAAWSPDGKRLAFVPPGGGISMSDADGRHVRHVTYSEEDSSPTWSPDGDRIAFTSGYEQKLYVIDANGENRRVLPVQDASELHWSPDGKSISFVNWEHGLRTISVEDGHLLDRGPRLSIDSFGEVAWSPDGRQLAYTRFGSRGSHLTVVKTDGTGTTKISSNAESAFHPLWSPDGRSIVYARRSPLGTGAELWEIQLEDRKSRRLTSLYPNGVNVMGPAAWIKGPVRPAAQAPEPTVVAQKDGAVLENPQPISHIAASGSLVAAVPPERIFGTVWVLTPPLLLWDPVSGKVERLSLASCQEGTGVALTRGQVGYTCLGGHAASVGSSVEAFSFDTKRPTSYFTGAYGDGVPDPALTGRIAGDQEFLFFTERKLAHGGEVVASKLWRVGAHGTTVIATGADAGEPAAADADRLAIERDDGVVTLMDAEGRVLGRISPGGAVIDDPPTFSAFPPATVELDGPDLVVLRGGLLRHYDSRSLKLVRHRPVPADAKLGGLAEGIAAYAAGGAVHVLRLDDGAEAVIPAGGGHLEETDLTPSGLFYAVNTQPVRNGYVHIGKNAPSRIVFIRWESLVNKLK